MDLHEKTYEFDFVSGFGVRCESFPCSVCKIDVAETAPAAVAVSFFFAVALVVGVGHHMKKIDGIAPEVPVGL